MSSKLKIFQYHNVHLYNLKQYSMHYKLVIFENHTKSTSLDITPEQARQILGVTDYTPEQYEILAEITNRPASYFMDDLVDYYVDF